MRKKKVSYDIYNIFRKEVKPIAVMLSYKNVEFLNYNLEIPWKFNLIKLRVNSTRFYFTSDSLHLLFILYVHFPS